MNRRDDGKMLYFVYSQLQIITVSLTEEMVLSLPDVEVWLPVLKEHSILPCLLDSVKIWLEVRDVEKTDEKKRINLGISRAKKKKKLKN